MCGGHLLATITNDIPELLFNLLLRVRFQEHNRKIDELDILLRSLLTLPNRPWTVKSADLSYASHVLPIKRANRFVQFLLNFDTRIPTCTRLQAPQASKELDNMRFLTSYRILN